MRSIRWLALAAFASSLCSTADAAPTRDRAADEVARFFMEGIGHFNRHDLDAFMRQFDPDIRMFVLDHWLRGAPALRERFAATFRQFPQVRMQITNLRARSVARNVVTVEFEFHTYPKGSGPAYHGVGSGTYVKSANGWNEVLEHESVLKRDAGD